MAGYGLTTSTSSILMGIGTRTFLVTETGDYKIGSRVRIVSDEDNYLDGKITAIFDNNITVNVDFVVGGGIYSRWVFSISGDPGVPGSTGATGPTGATGAAGPFGATGYAGSQGIPGTAVAQGATGIIGPRGATGPVGATGAVGFVGSQGTIGFTGSQGAIGYCGSFGVSGSCGDIGATGVPGATGPLGYTGSRGIIGPTGFVGSQGIQGDPGGATGPLGYTGSQGATGPIGIRGMPGNQGYTGSLGASGYTGSKGETGATGLVGATGVADISLTYFISSIGSVNYVFSGPGIVAGNTDNPVLYLYRGFTYTFVNTTGGAHPFAIRVSAGGSDYTSGVSGSQTGTQVFTVPMNAPGTLYYQCTIHSSMGNTINIV
jgi:hypothetical protein